MDSLMDSLQNAANRLGYLGGLGQETQNDFVQKKRQTAVLATVTGAALLVAAVAPIALGVAVVAGGAALWRGKQTADAKRFLGEVKDEARLVYAEAQAQCEKGSALGGYSLASAFNTLRQQNEQIASLGAPSAKNKTAALACA